MQAPPRTSGPHPGEDHEDDDYVQGEEGSHYGAMAPGDEAGFQDEEDGYWEGDEGHYRQEMSSRSRNHYVHGVDDDDEEEEEYGIEGDDEDDGPSMTLEEYQRLQKEKKATSSLLQTANKSLPPPRTAGEGERFAVRFGRAAHTSVTEGKAVFKAAVSYRPPLRTESMTWTRCDMELPVPRTSMVAFAYPRDKPTDPATRVWIYGGINNQEIILSDGLLLDLEKMKISGRNFAGPAVPARSSAAGALYGPRFFLVGGFGSKGRDGSLYVLNLSIHNDSQSHWGERHQPLVLPKYVYGQPELPVKWCGCPVKDLNSNRSALEQPIFSEHGAHYRVVDPLEPLSHHSAVVVAGKDGAMYVFGGRRGKTIVNNLHVLPLSLVVTTIRHTMRDANWNQRYLVSTSECFQWRKNAPTAPPPRMAHAACMVNPSLMWIIGGYDGTRELTDVWVLDVRTRVWTEKKLFGSLPPLSYHSATYINSYIFVFGGYSRGQFSNALFVIDPANLRVTQFDVRGDIPTPRGGHAAVALNNRLLIIGGHNGQGSLSDMFFLENVDNFTLHESMLGVEVAKQFNTPAFADVMFEWSEAADGKPRYVLAHKCILAARSPEFMKLFSNETPLRRKQMPTVPGQSASAAGASPNSNATRTIDVILMEKTTNVEVFTKFLEFLYSDIVSLSSSDAAEMLALARKYQVQQLERVCQSVQEERVFIPPSTYMTEMRGLMRNTLFSDVQFIVQEKPIPAHRVLVAARCEYFRNMLLGQFREAQEQRIRLDEIEFELFDAILNYLYTDMLDTSNVQMLFDMLCQSDLFGLEYLKSRCEKLLSSQMLTGSTAVLLYQAGVMFHSPELATKAFHYILHEINASYGYSDELMESLTPEIVEKVNEIRTAQGRSRFELHSAQQTVAKLINWRNNCTHCQLPYMYDVKTWPSDKKTPKEMLSEWYVQNQRHKEPKYEPITTRNQIGHHAKVVLPHLGKAILMKRPARSKKEAEHNAAVLALHHLNCGLVQEFVIETV